MAAVSTTSAGRRRWVWHPLAAGLSLTAAALAVAGAVAAGGVPPWLALGAWLLMGLVAGYATSGST